MIYDAERREARQAKPVRGGNFFKENSFQKKQPCASEGANRLLTAVAQWEMCLIFSSMKGTCCKLCGLWAFFGKGKSAISGGVQHIFRCM